VSPRSARSRRLVLAAAIAVAVVAADQLSKWLVLRDARHLPLRIMPGARLELTYNTGISFSRFAGGGLVLKVAIAVVVVVLCVMLWRTRGRYAVWLALILGGAVGNLVDRVRTDAVTDFISIGPWPTFNLADMAIAAGAVGLVAALLFAGDERSDDAAVHGQRD
jgi:signal peptidase II